MPKYLCLQRNLPTATTSGQRPSPAEMQAMYERFNAWRETFAQNLVDPGGRLGASKLATAEQIPDGPFIELKELIGGYMIVSAPSHEEAVHIAQQCPGLVQAGSGVEVIEIRTPQ